MTASRAVSRQMLHSNVARSRSRSPSALPPLLLPPGPSRSLLLSPAVDPPLLAGPMSLEDRGPAAAIVFTVQVRKVEPPDTRPDPSRANVSWQSKASVTGPTLPLSLHLSHDFRFRKNRRGAGTIEIVSTHYENINNNIIIIGYTAYYSYY